MALKNVSNDSFEQDVLGTDKPVLVDLWGSHEGRCAVLLMMSAMRCCGAKTRVTAPGARRTWPASKRSRSR
jgi:hypothetical protein